MYVYICAEHAAEKVFNSHWGSFSVIASVTVLALSDKDTPYSGM